MNENESLVRGRQPARQTDRHTQTHGQTQTQTQTDRQTDRHIHTNACRLIHEPHKQPKKW